MSGFYASADADFRLFETIERPSWRNSQRGALGALISHWSLQRHVPAVISIPTGSGKSAIAIAAPYLARPTRVLVVVPSRDLRSQMAYQFEREEVLRSVGAREGSKFPRVLEVTGRIKDWSELRAADVVVGIPTSISPAHYEGDQLPARELFDLIIIDEAHHAPAATWRAILDYFASARALLLTATPQRRDGKRIPGDLVFHYPLRQALDDGTYKPVRPLAVDLGNNPEQSHSDELIAAQVVRIAGELQHATSTILIRTSKVNRAEAVARIYAELGLNVAVLSTKSTDEQRRSTIRDLKNGSLRAVAVVDMLGEGFDLPSLRVAAYHDKHKSAAATIQLIGRLARVNDDFPQESVIVTGRDEDVYPHLRGAVRSLWEEDADWGQVLPDLIDVEIEDAAASRAFASELEVAPPELAIEAVQPVVRATLYEVTEQDWEPSFATGELPTAVAVGQPVRGSGIFYSSLTPTNATLVVVTSTVVRPKWHSTDPGLDTREFDIHLMTWRPAATQGQAGVLAINSADQAMAASLIKKIGAEGRLRRADPERLQDAFDSLDRISVSNVGVRNTYMGSPGVPSYKMFAGSGVDRGLRDADTGRAALGHAMAQIDVDNRTYNAGIATAKGKFWESRYVKLREYEQSVTDFIDRYWFPPASGPGRLLPNVSRGVRFREFPEHLVAAIEPDPALYIQDWEIGNVPIGDLIFTRDESATAVAARLPVAAFAPMDPATPVWRGFQDAEGIFSSTQAADAIRGYGSSLPLEQLLTERPPSIYYSDGVTVIGATMYRPTIVRNDFSQIRIEHSKWENVEINAETRRSVKSESRLSVGESLEAWPKARQKRRRHRWILLNDGPREFADYLVLEIDPGPAVTLELWHAKGANGVVPGVRLNDMQVVIAQAIKSRRWVTERSFWSEMRDRYTGASSPRLEIIEGREVLFEILCGLRGDHELFSLVKWRPNREATIGIAQPGLSESELREQLQKGQIPVPASQIGELLTVWHDAVGNLGSLTLLISA